MSSLQRSIYLFADSQLLFWKTDGVPFLNSITASLPDPASARAVYLGASNGDAPAFYQIFESAMQCVGVGSCRMVHSSYPASDRKAVDEADIILLAGGDIDTGWKAFQSTGLAEQLVEKYQQGTTLMGVSAGAVQLGQAGWKGEDPSPENIFDTLKLVPFIIGAHEEKADWATLKKVIGFKEQFTRGLGIVAGGGMIYHPNHTVEPVRYPLHEFLKTNVQISHRFLFPKNGLTTPGARQ